MGHVLLGNHHASGTRPVGFVWRSHRPADDAHTGCDDGPPAFASVLKACTTGDIQY